MTFQMGTQRTHGSFASFLLMLLPTFLLVLLLSILQLGGKSAQLAYLMKVQPSEAKPHVFSLINLGAAL